MTDAERSFLGLLAIGVFSIDEQGRIWKHRRLIAGSQQGTPPYWKDHDPTIRAERSISDGYPTVMFSDGTKRHKVFAHRVVWMVVNQQDIPPGMQVNHKNGKRGDTYPTNLEMVIPSENAIHAIRVLGRTVKGNARQGEANSCAVLTAGQVMKIRALAGKMSQPKIAEMFGIVQATVSAIVLRKSWKHLA